MILNPRITLIGMQNSTTKRSRTICHVSTSDSSGGAAIAAFNLHTATNRSDAGWSSKMVVRDRRSDDADVTQISQFVPSGFLQRAFQWRNLQSKIDRTDWSRNSGFELCSGMVRANYRVADRIDADVEIVQLNWVADFLDWAAFMKSAKWPLVWRLADMNPFTGGCHYASDCKGFMDGCHECPQLFDAETATARVFDEKSKALGYLGDDQLTIVTQSHWMRDLVQASPLLRRFRQKTIPNGVNRQQFFPRDQDESRKQLGLDSGKPIALLCGTGPQNRRGVDRLLAEISDRSLESVHLLILGRTRVSYSPHLSGITFVGQVPHEHLGTYYSAADVLLFPSLQDNCPNTVLEAQACGVPVLAFDGSGTSELINGKNSGWLTPCGDFTEMASRLNELIATGVIRAAKQNSEQLANSVRTTSEMLDDYLKLYDSILSHDKSN